MTTKISKAQAALNATIDYVRTAYAAGNYDCWSDAADAAKAAGSRSPRKDASAALAQVEAETDAANEAAAQAARDARFNERQAVQDAIYEAFPLRYLQTPADTKFFSSDAEATDDETPTCVDCGSLLDGPEYSGHEDHCHDCNAVYEQQQEEQQQEQTTDEDYNEAYYAAEEAYTEAYLTAPANTDARQYARSAAYEAAARQVNTTEEADAIAEEIDASSYTAHLRTADAVTNAEHNRKPGIYYTEAELQSIADHHYNLFSDDTAIAYAAACDATYNKAEGTEAAERRAEQAETNSRASVAARAAYYEAETPDQAYNAAEDTARSAGASDPTLTAQRIHATNQGDHRPQEDKANEALAAYAALDKPAGITYATEEQTNVNQDDTTTEDADDETNNTLPGGSYSPTAPGLNRITVDLSNARHGRQELNTPAAEAPEHQPPTLTPRQIAHVLTRNAATAATIEQGRRTATDLIHEHRLATDPAYDYIREAAQALRRALDKAHEQLSAEAYAYLDKLPRA